MASFENQDRRMPKIEACLKENGLASLDDVRELLKPRAARLEGAITGKALYDGRLDPAAALALIARTRGAA